MPTGCEVCGDLATVTTAGMCLCAPCAGAPSYAASGIVSDAVIKTLDPFGMRHYLTQIPTDTEEAATRFVKKPLTEAASTMKVAFVAGSLAVIAFVAYEIFKPRPREERFT